MYTWNNTRTWYMLRSKRKKHIPWKKKRKYSKKFPNRNPKKKEEKATFQEISNRTRYKDKRNIVATIKNAVSATDTRARVVHAQLKRRGPHSADHCSPSGDTPRSWMNPAGRRWVSVERMARIFHKGEPRKQHGARPRTVTGPLLPRPEEDAASLSLSVLHEAIIVYSSRPHPPPPILCETVPRDQL